MTEEKKPRAGSMSDADRALTHRRTATPARGVRIPDFVEPERTPPPSDVEELIRRLWPLRNADQLLGGLSTQVTRLEGRADNLEKLAGGIEEIGEHVAEDAKVHRDITEKLADIHGKSGSNGKLGELRRRVDNLSSKAWWLFTAIVGGVGAALVKLVIVVRAFDAVEGKAARSADEIKVLQAQVMTLQTALIARSPWPAAPAESVPK